MGLSRVVVIRRLIAQIVGKARKEGLFFASTVETNAVLYYATQKQPEIEQKFV